MSALPVPYFRGTPNEALGLAPVSTTEEGRAFIIRVLGGMGYRPCSVLTITMMALAENESSAKLRRPARSFENREPGHRHGRGRITAWGPFQYNYEAWQGLWEDKSYLGGRAAARGPIQRAPWEASDVQSVQLPARRNELLMRYMLARGYRNPWGFYVAVRTLHSGSSRLRSWLAHYQPGDNPLEKWRSWAHPWRAEHDDIWQQARTEITRLCQTRR